MSYSKKVMVQIFAGGFKGEIERAGEIIKRLERLLSQISIEAVIIGWTADRELYNELYRYLNDRGIKMHLWYPLFSEVGLFRPLQKVVGHRGAEIKSYAFHEGENFEFYCPADGDNLKMTVEIFEELYKGVSYDGVFLDKIRYPAFSNGVEGLFTCFCPGCCEKMEGAGLALKETVRAVERVLKQSGLLLELESCSHGEVSFKDPLLESLFRFKNETIFKSLSTVTNHFRKRDKMVGFDLYAPSLSYFCGQNINSLIELCDFVKPMYYRRTRAPAGLPFELDFLIKESARPFSREQFQQKLGLSGSAEVLTDGEMVKELNSINTGEKIYVGFEVNRVEGVVDSESSYIERCLQVAEDSKAGGVVLSWNLMDFPEDNLNYILKSL